MNDSDSSPNLSFLIAEAFHNARVNALKFKEMSELCPISAWISDSDGKIIYVNSAYKNLTGFSLEELQQDSSQSIFLDDRKTLIDSWNTYAADPNNESYIWRETARIIRKDNYPIRCTIIGKKILNNGFVGFTAPSSILPDLLNFETPLGNFFKLSPDLLVIADDLGYFVKVSKAWSEKFGYEPLDLLNNPYIKFVHPDDQEKTIKIAADMKNESILDFENRYFNKKTNCYHKINWSASKYENNFTYAVGRDLGAAGE